jgi:hypothetical protein
VCFTAGLNNPRAEHSNSTTLQITHYMHNRCKHCSSVMMMPTLQALVVVPVLLLYKQHTSPSTGPGMRQSYSSIPIAAIQSRWATSAQLSMLLGEHAAEHAGQHETQHAARAQNKH